MSISHPRPFSSLTATRSRRGGTEDSTAQFTPELGRRVLRLGLSEWTLLTIGLIALSLGGALNLLFPWLVKEFLNGRWGFSLERDLTWITLSFIGLFAVQGIMFFVRGYAFQVSGYRIVSRLRARLFDSLLTQDVAFFDSARVGDLLSRLSADTSLVQRAVTINISIALRYLLQVLGGIALMCTISIKLTLLITLLIPISLGAGILWGRRLRKLSRELQTKLGEATVIAEESLGAIRTVKLFLGETFESRRHSQAVNAALGVGERRAVVSSAFSSAMVFVVYSCIALTLWYGGTLVITQELSSGDLIAFLLYCVMVAMALGFLFNVWDEFLQAVGGAERIYEILDTIPKVASGDAPIILANGNARADVAFNEVHFCYPSRPELEVIRGISFEIKDGETVALVGPSGSGKSTIASLLTRFYDPTSGSISFGGVDIRSLSLKDLRGAFSVVSQDPQVFSVSIGENIAYGRLGATKEEIIEATKVAQIYDFICSLPEGFDTLVGDRGIQLSGGQRQRVAIARAVLKNPRFLILDEATSALDSKHEHEVKQALNRLMENRTSLIIAHRLSTVQHANQVIVLKDGKIVQHGSHLELVGKPGLYKSLVEHQML